MTPPLGLLAAAAVLATLIVGATLGLLWIARVVLHAIASLYASRFQVAQAFPVQIIDEGEGTYRIEGVLRPTEEDVVWLIHARTRANAIAKAEMRGAVVTQVMKLSTTEEPAPVELIEPSDHHPVTTV